VTSVVAFVLLAASPDAITRTAAKQELSRAVEQPGFLEWEGEYSASKGTPENGESSDVTISDCNPGGCAFEAVASFGAEPTKDYPDPPSGACSYSGRFRFLSSGEAAAWYAGRGKPEFGGELSVLLASPDSEGWSRLGFVRKGRTLVLQESIATNGGFCGAHPAAFYPMERAAFHPPPGGPASDCKKARSEAEKAICGTPALAALDLRLSQQFAKARQASKPAARGGLLDGQRAFLKKRDACKADASCLRDVYQARLQELAGP
jgi:uncharacterized protein YecT (DUF1311 family)